MIDLKEVEQIIVQANEQCILPKFRNLLDNEIERKSNKSYDVVTVADKEAEIFIKEKILEKDHNALFIGEESSHKNPEEIRLLTQDKPVWIIDPIDGTTNYSNGIEKFGTIISCVKNNETIYGCIYNPITETLITAEKGSGCWCKGKKIKLDSTILPKESLAIMSLQFFKKDQAEVIANRASNFLNWKNNFGSVAIDYQACVLKKAQIAVFNYIRVWDHAAGILIHHEAGGYSAKFDGSQYQPIDENGGLILAPSRDIWNYFSNNVMKDIQV